MINTFCRMSIMNDVESPTPISPIYVIEQYVIGNFCIPIV